ncbi:LegC family aminotransferase [Paenibacillus sp. GCM10012307]|uniref:LegC family aminotransferase n=1 Tax=Paenibacillus roseus TaxID=2798579 RepID=A0A934J1Q7_9BACL|nr:LegC family aminotransferase [Paenibacillus roseus]MBJ6359974.1 LegC family aminotransferase [Paenibacillus roseus]
MTSHPFVQDVLERLRKVLPSGDQAHPLHAPHFAGNEWRYVKECLDTGWVSSVGAFVNRLEQDLAAYTGIKHAIAVVNGSAALHISLTLSGVEAGDEVLIPALTFVATANAVSYCGAIPHLVDSSETTLGLDPEKLDHYLRKKAVLKDRSCYNARTGRRIRAVVPMHTLGHPVDLEPLAEICAHYKLKMVEDAAESLGSFYKGRHTGSWGEIAAISLNGNKIITAGGGGALLTNDEKLARKAKHLTTTAKLPHRWNFVHDQTGFNYRLPNLNAALAVAQLERLPVMLASKRSLASAYEEAFRQAEGIRFFQEPSFAVSNYWLNALLLDESHAAHLEGVLEQTNQAGIMTRPLWTPLHQLPMLKRSPRMDLSTAESLARRVINLPSSAFLQEADGRGA